MRQYRDAHIFMDLYKNLIRPLLFLADPEVVHHGAMAALKVAGPVLAKFAPKPDPRLARTVFGVTFPNPVGLAAGFDKNAVALPAWEALGFGFAEVGTITARAQPGNPKPRIFRVPECAGLINRLGFNNDGCDAVEGRLQRLRESGRWPAIPVGINLGKSKIVPIAQLCTSCWARSRGATRRGVRCCSRSRRTSTGR